MATRSGRSIGGGYTISLQFSMGILIGVPNSDMHAKSTPKDMLRILR
jgi:hypothetical protein